MHTENKAWCDRWDVQCGVWWLSVSLDTPLLCLHPSLTIKHNYLHHITNTQITILFWYHHDKFLGEMAHRNYRQVMFILVVHAMCIYVSVKTLSISIASTHLNKSKCNTTKMAELFLINISIFGDSSTIASLITSYVLFNGHLP